MPWKCFLNCVRSQAEDVRQLDYQHGMLQDVPPEVFAYERTLEELYLDSNRIRDLPRPLFHCHGLRVLSMSDNEVQSLPPAIASLINLQHLDLSRNELCGIPDNIKGCKHLVYVDVSVNQLEKLPEGFTQLLSLEELYLNDTCLDFLPANFGRLTKLRILELRENNLNTLPKSIARLTSLERMDIGQNEFSDLPEVIGRLVNLTELWVDCNRVRSVPKFIGNLKKLMHLDASTNNINWIAPEIGSCSSLTDLTLSCNEIPELPDTIGNLKMLVTMKLDDNQLTSLPPSIGKLSNLEELILSQNDFEALPPCIGLLRKLNILNADDNMLEDLPPEIGSCTSLTILSVRSNKLQEVPAELGHLPKIRVMNLSDNQLRNLPVSILNLTYLTALWLSNNQSTPLTTLQQEVDKVTGQTVCVNFMLPQSSQELYLAENINDGNPDLKINSRHIEKAVDRPHIRFAADTDSEVTGHLVRAPTPYPKELRAMAKHARSFQQQHSRRVSRESESEVPLLGEMVSPGPKGVLIKEAKVKKPSTVPVFQLTESKRNKGNEDEMSGVSTNTGISASKLESSETTNGDGQPVLALGSGPQIREAKCVRQVTSSTDDRDKFLGQKEETLSPRDKFLNQKEEALSTREETLSPRDRFLSQKQEVLSSSDKPLPHEEIVSPRDMMTAREKFFSSQKEDTVTPVAAVDVVDGPKSFQYNVAVEPPPYHIAAVYSKQAAYFHTRSSTPSASLTSQKPPSPVSQQRDVPISELQVKESKALEDIPTAKEQGNTVTVKEDTNNETRNSSKPESSAFSCENKNIFLQGHIEEKLNSSSEVPVDVDQINSRILGSEKRSDDNMDTKYHADVQNSLPDVVMGESKMPKHTESQTIEFSESSDSVSKEYSPPHAAATVSLNSTQIFSQNAEVSSTMEQQLKTSVTKQNVSTNDSVNQSFEVPSTNKSAISMNSVKNAIFSDTREELATSDGSSIDQGCKQDTIPTSSLMTEDIKQPPLSPKCRIPVRLGDPAKSPVPNNLLFTNPSSFSQDKPSVNDNLFAPTPQRPEFNTPKPTSPLPSKFTSTPKSPLATRSGSKIPSLLPSATLMGKTETKSQLRNNSPSPKPDKIIEPSKYINSTGVSSHNRSAASNNWSSAGSEAESLSDSISGTRIPQPGFYSHSPLAYQSSKRGSVSSQSSSGSRPGSVAPLNTSVDSSTSPISNFLNKPHFSSTDHNLNISSRIPTATTSPITSHVGQLSSFSSSYDSSAVQGNLRTGISNEQSPVVSKIPMLATSPVSPVSRLGSVQQQRFYSPNSSETSPGKPKTWMFGPHKNATVDSSRSNFLVKFPVTIKKNPGLGFSITGGLGSPSPLEKRENEGIFVSKVHPNGPASNCLMPGDKILEVDGTDFTKLEHDQAVGILKQTGSVVNMMISRQQ